MLNKILFFTCICGSLAACAPSSSTNTDVETKDSSALSGISLSEIDTVHTSQNSLDWAGTYEGTLPCADCPGIQTEIVLNEDETFRIQSAYLERDSKVEDSGSFTWYNNGGSIHLKGNATDVHLKVGENQLFYLDEEGKVIEGPNGANYLLLKK
ncbi:copper resistance protein NlpE [Sphingobacterium wenxiniae]|uniref:NlpE N-terminal domain-containing protein n=1 Tax=Sphingobacterium wenxiniae TaxID=683125 RepID=A0A1I6RBR4_9SPHI|nr:copper resistance protein NlpE [Sphingobacterium wenxiniae]SFS62177.1 NlpE N-terminal domain-containing protein [Sphingobacterium wenxiniae]